MRLAEQTGHVRRKFSVAWSLYRRYLRQVPSLGLAAGTVLFLCEASSRSPFAQLVRPFAPERVKVRPAGYTHPISFRRVGSDTAVVHQMLVRREYGPVAALKDVDLIVDCGANIGISAYYFLHCYPNARVIAVEPDPENYALCRHNLAPFGVRAVVLRAAVWPENRRLRIAPASVRLGAWALRVEPWDAGDVEGLTIREILHRAGADGPIDLLKMDVEGSETELFRRAAGWLDQTRNIAIELHGPEARAAFAGAMAGYRYERRESGEITIVYGLRPAI